MSCGRLSWKLKKKVNYHVKNINNANYSYFTNNLNMAQQSEHFKC